MIPWKVFWPVLGFGVSLAGAGVPILLHLNPFAVTGAVVLVAVGAILGARSEVHHGELLGDEREATQDNIAGMIYLAIFAHAVWITVFQFAPGMWTWWPMVLLAMAGAEYLGAWLAERSMRHRKPEAGRTAEGAPLSDPEQFMSAALFRSGLGSLAMVKSEELRECDE